MSKVYTNTYLAEIQNIAVDVITALDSVTVDGAVSVTNFPATQAISGNVGITGTVSLPTGASTSGKQDTGNTSMASIDTKTPALGQTTMVNSTPVVIASNQSTVAVSIATMPSTPVTGPLTDTQLRASALPVSQSGTFTVQPGNTANTTAWKVDGSAVTQPISGTVTANVGSVNGLALDATLTGGTQKAIVRSAGKGSTTAGDVTSTAVDANTQALDVQVKNFPATQPVSGTVTATGPLTDTQLRASAVPVSGPLTDTQIRATALPISGTVTANQGGTWTVQPGNTANTTAWKVDGSAVTQPVSGTVTANVGTLPSLTKGTQGSTGLTVQELKDASRTAVMFSANNVASGTTTTETAITMTKSSGTSATSSAASFVITSGKTFRITAITVATRGSSTATIQSTIFNLRLNTAGGVTTSSTPVLLSIQSATAAVASAWDRVFIEIPDGLEIAGNGTIQFGMTAAATFVTNAPTWSVNIIGFEY